MDGFADAHLRVEGVGPERRADLEPGPLARPEHQVRAFDLAHERTRQAMPVRHGLGKVEPERRVEKPRAVLALRVRSGRQVDCVGSGRPRMRLEMMLFWISAEPP